MSDINQAKATETLTHGGIEQLRNELIQGELDIPQVACTNVEVEEGLFEKSIHPQCKDKRYYETEKFGKFGTSGKTMYLDEASYTKAVKAEDKLIATTQGVLEVTCPTGTSHNTTITYNGQKINHVNKAVITINADQGIATAELTFVIPKANLLVHGTNVTTTVVETE